MQKLVVQFRDFPNSGRVIRGSPSRARGRDVQVSVDGKAFRLARFGRPVEFVRKHTLGQKLALVSFEEVERGVYEARWATGYNVYAFDGGCPMRGAYRAG